MNSTKNRTVIAESYQSDIVVLNSFTFSMTQHHRYDEITRDIDVFANFWSFAFAELKKGEVWMRSEQNDIELEGPCAVFFPQHCIAEWKVSPGIKHWSCLISEAKLPEWAPVKPMLFRLGSFNLTIQNEADVFQFLQQHPNGLIVEKNETNNPTALKLRKRLNAEFFLKQPISKYAEELGISHEGMTRYFKACYGLSPHEYRNKLRLMQIMTELVLKPDTIAKTLRQFGFDDPSHFNQQFKKILRTVPTSFKEPKTTERTPSP